MKNIFKSTTTILYLIVILLLATACDKPQEGLSYPKGPELPNELFSSKISNDIYIEYKAKYKSSTNNNAELSFYKFQNYNTNVSAFSIFIRGETIAGAFDVTEVKGKTIKAEYNWTVQSQNYKVDFSKTYTLCTNYTITGSESGTTLTFTGGDIPEISDKTWVLE